MTPAPDRSGTPGFETPRARYEKAQPQILPVKTIIDLRLEPSTPEQAAWTALAYRLVASSPGADRPAALRFARAWHHVALTRAIRAGGKLPPWRHSA